MSRSPLGRYLDNILYEIGYQYGAAEHTNKAEIKCRGQDKTTPLFIESVNEKWHRKEEDHREQEKIYWRRYLRLNAAIALFTGFGAGLAYEAYKAASTQAGEAVKQTAISQAAFIATQRPWVFPEKVEADFHLSILNTNDAAKAAAVSQLRFTLKNSGPTPAINVFIIQNGIVPSDKHKDIFAEQKKACKDVTARPGAENLGEPIFPGETIPNEQGVFLLAGEITPVFKYMTSGVPFIVVGCILYKFSFEAAYHKTGFAYVILKKKDLRYPDFQDGDVSIADLTIIPWPDGSKAFFAD